MSEVYKRGYEGLFSFDSWLYLKNLVESAMEVGAGLIFMVEKIQKYSARRLLKILQRIGQEVLTSCQGASLWYTGAGC